ncbi:MAG: hypothetical protein M1838_001955 [Thelocarpon superellum]|nr:MAG: hypothetical protein M1838_001955 [Thelocarpon superellum]
MAEDAAGTTTPPPPAAEPPARPLPAEDEAGAATNGGAGDAAPAGNHAQAEADPIAKTTGVSEDVPTGAIAVAEPLTPASGKKGKRKSITGVPEHRMKKVNRKKSQVLTHLDAQPGEYYFARLKGHPPWPAMVCDEEMLPQALLATRPVTAKKPDGTYREAFAEGGKRVQERTFPVMYMGTYEFGWIPNTDLTELDPHTVGQEAEKGKSKSLAYAYTVTAEAHDIAYFKNLLKEHQEALRADAEAKANKKKAKGKGKSKVEVDDGDEDAEEPEGMDVDEPGEGDGGSTKKSKKRKKEAEDDDEDSKPAKTPKRSDSKKNTSTPKLKLTNPKTPNGVSAGKSASKGSSAKAGKAKGSTAKKAARKPGDSDEEMADASALVEEKPLTPAEILEKKQKEIFFLRHKLQKGLLTRDGPPKEEEMKTMSDYIKKLETMADLEVSIMRTTKIHKVLRGIIKLSSIPQDAEFKFKQRSHDLLQIWNRLLAADGGAAADKDAHEEGETEKEKEKERGDKGEKTNGVSKEETVTEKGTDEEAAGEDKEWVVVEKEGVKDDQNGVSAPQEQEKESKELEEEGTTEGKKEEEAETEGEKA